MNCINCNVVRFNSGAYETEGIICENGHFLCTECWATSKTRCKQCGERLFDYNENIPIIQDYSNWTQNMIDDWTEKSIRYASDSNGELSVLEDSASLKLLFSRSKSFDEENVDNNKNDINMLNSKGKQTCENTNLEGQNSNYVENAERTEFKSNLVRKDTRQNLVDQLKQEIRAKIEEKICNLFKNDQRSLIKPDEHMCAKQCKTIGVSTESEPIFLRKFQSYKGSKEDIIQIIDLNKKKYNEAAQDHFEMNVDAIHNINSQIMDIASGQKSSSVVDQQLQQVIGTVSESGEHPTPTMSEDKQFYKMLQEKFSKMTPNKMEQIISSICNADGSKNSGEDHVQCQSALHHRPVQTKSDFPLISNSSRASYSPPSRNHIAAFPKPQFQLIATDAAKPLAQTVDARTLNIPRSPLKCPISSCRQACFVSDFTRHIAVDHTNVPMERILPRHCKNFFMDPKLIHFGSNRCQMLFLAKDKIKNLGHKKFKDVIPVLVMSTKVSTFQLCCNKSDSLNADAKNITDWFLMIWLTGLMPPQVPIFFSLAVWARTGNMPSCHIVHCGQLYSIRNSQNPSTIQESGQKLLLSQYQVDLLTNNGRNMLELQIVIN